MSAFVEVLDKRRAAIKGCGRVCVDMDPQSGPVIPPSPPKSLLEMLRAHPDVVIDPDWLAAMEADETIH